VIAKDPPKLIKIPLLRMIKPEFVAIKLIVGEVIFALSIFIAVIVDVLPKVILPDNISELVIDILVSQLRTII
jgi:hypothetical protein